MELARGQITLDHYEHIILSPNSSSLTNPTLDSSAPIAEEEANYTELNIAPARLRTWVGYVTTMYQQFASDSL